eukprot:3768262-Pleurochrysis_carterae.AAC.1
MEQTNSRQAITGGRANLGESADGIDRPYLCAASMDGLQAVVLLLGGEIGGDPVSQADDASADGRNEQENRAALGRQRGGG